MSGWYQGTDFNNEDEIAFAADAPWLNGDYEDWAEDLIPEECEDSDITDAAWEDDCWAESAADYQREF